MDEVRGEAVADPATAGQYSVIAKLGQGGMASVFLAVDQGAIADFHKLVVLKRLHESLRGDADFVKMFVGEARIAARLNHPNVVHTYSVDLQEGEPVLVMEYLDGVSFSALRKRVAGRPFEERLVLVASMAEALAGLQYVHALTDYDGASMGLVHRDIKPANIFVTYDGQTKVLDFGVAKATAPGQDVTNSRVLKGTARYMAPEAVGGGSLDARADVFSVGVVLWELASGHPLWDGVDELQIIRRLMDNDVPTLDSEGVDAPAELSRICAKALQRDPDDRYPTAEALRKDLAAFVVDQGLSDVGGALRMVMEVEFGHRRKLRATSIRERLEGLKQASAVETDDVRTLPSASTSLPSGSSDVGPVSSVTTSTTTTAPRRGSMTAVVLAGGVSLCVGALGVWLWSSGSVGEPGSKVLPEPAAVSPTARTPHSPTPAPPEPEPEHEPEPLDEAEADPPADVVPAVAVDSAESGTPTARRPRTKPRARRSPKTPEPEPAAAGPAKPADPPMQPGEMPTKKVKKKSGLSLDKESPWGGRP